MKRAFSPNVENFLMVTFYLFLFEFYVSKCHHIRKTFMPNSKIEKVFEYFLFISFILRNIFSLSVLSWVTSRCPIEWIFFLLSFSVTFLLFKKRNRIMIPPIVKIILQNLTCVFVNFLPQFEFICSLVKLLVQFSLNHLFLRVECFW